MADKASGGSHCDPAAARALVAFVVAFPGEFRDRPAAAGVIADIEPGGERDEAISPSSPLNAMKAGPRRSIASLSHTSISAMRHLPWKGCGQRRKLLLRHHAAAKADCAISFGRRTRL